jgi:hypothetical protein
MEGSWSKSGARGRWRGPASIVAKPDPDDCHARRDTLDFRRAVKGSADWLDPEEPSRLVVSVSQAMDFAAAKTSKRPW